jgi:hypothetical protein
MQDPTIIGNVKYETDRAESSFQTEQINIAANFSPLIGQISSNHKILMVFKRN